MTHPPHQDFYFEIFSTSELGFKPLQILVVTKRRGVRKKGALPRYT